MSHCIECGKDMGITADRTCQDCFDKLLDMYDEIAEFDAIEALLAKEATK